MKNKVKVTNKIFKVNGEYSRSIEGIAKYIGVTRQAINIYISKNIDLDNVESFTFRGHVIEIIKISLF